MKKLLNPNLEINNEGNKFKLLLKDRIKTTLSDYVKMGYDLLDIDYISKAVLNEIMETEKQFINNYFNNKKYNVNELKIYNIKNNDEKFAEFIGIDKDGNRMWMYEENYIPELPFIIKDLGNDIKYYYLIIDINDK